MNEIDYKNPISKQSVLNAGIVALMAVQGNDATPAQVAKTSFADNFKAATPESLHNLDDYLLRKKHETPFEFPDATWYMVLPIFVARQLIRHRTSSVNEESLRYIEPRAEFWIPSVDECKAAAANVKQGSSTELIADPEGFIELVTHNGQRSHIDYHTATNGYGASKEISRTMLPLGQYTAWYWKASLRNTLGLLALRTDPHAQYQVQVYAGAMLEQLRPFFPAIIAAWENHVRYAVTFSRDEMSILNRLLFSVESEAMNAVLDSATVTLRGTRRAEFKAKLGQV